MTFYAQRKSINNGETQPVINKYGTQAEMEYQFHLFCASAVKTDVRDIDAIEWGTIEQGVIERKKYVRPVEITPTESETEPIPEVDEMGTE